MLNYKTVNGYQIPDLKIPDEQVTLGKYGRMRKAYLKEHRKMTFNSLLLTGELTAHLAEIDRTAGERVNRMVSEMAAAQGVNEALKERDPMAWVGATMEKRHRPVMIGAVCGALVPAAAAGVVGGMMNAAGFGAVFVGLHRLIFTNSNWLLNPATDILIRMMPQALFETALRDVLGQFALAFALAVLLLAAAYAVVSGMVKRQLTQTEERP